MDKNNKDKVKNGLTDVVFNDMDKDVLNKSKSKIENRLSTLKSKENPSGEEQAIIASLEDILNGIKKKIEATNDVTPPQLENGPDDNPTKSPGNSEQVEGADPETRKINEAIKNCIE